MSASGGLHRERVVRERVDVPVPSRPPGHRGPAMASARERASSELRDTSTRGTPTPSSEAVSEPMPWPAPWAFSPTAGRQQTIVGETTGTRPSSGRSITTATLPRSPASQCSLCAISVVSGSRTDTLEQRSSGAGPAVGHRRLDVALLPLQEQQLALGGLEERLELLERVDREQLEDRHHRPDRHAFQHVHGLGVRGLRADEVRGQQVLQLFGRDAPPFEVPVVEADGGLHEVHELLADVDAAVEPVALRPHDPDVPHARIMGEPRRAR